MYTCAWLLIVVAWYRYRPSLMVLISLNIKWAVFQDNMFSVSFVYIRGIHLRPIPRAGRVFDSPLTTIGRSFQNGEIRSYFFTTVYNLVVELV